MHYVGVLSYTNCALCCLAYVVQISRKSVRARHVCGLVTDHSVEMLYNWHPTELQGLPVDIELAELHALMGCATYDNLVHVELNITVVDAFLERYAHRARREVEVEAGFRALFAPWDERLAESFVLRKLW